MKKLELYSINRSTYLFSPGGVAGHIKSRQVLSGAVNIIISPRRTDPRLYYQSARTDTKYIVSPENTITNTNPNPEP